MQTSFRQITKYKIILICDLNGMMNSYIVKVNDNRRNATLLVDDAFYNARRVPTKIARRVISRTFARLKRPLHFRRLNSRIKRSSSIFFFFVVIDVGVIFWSVERYTVSDRVQAYCII